MANDDIFSLGDLESFLDQADNAQNLAKADEIPKEGEDKEDIKEFDFSMNSPTVENPNEMTNLDFLSRMMSKNLRGYFKSNYSWLVKKFSRDILDTFMGICDKLGDEDVEIDVFDIVLKDMGITDVRHDIILSNFEKVKNDKSGVIEKSTYERFREIVYKAYFDSVNNGNAVETLEKIQSSEFFLPPYGIIESETFKQVDFGDIDVDSIVEDLGAPLYSHFKEINDVSPIHGYIPSQVTMIAAPPSCFVGSTKVRTPNGIKTLYELNQDHRPSSVMYANLENGEVDWTWDNKGCKMTGSSKELIKIFVTTQPDFPIVCTLDHKFLVINLVKGFEWVEAQNLKEGQILMSSPMKEYVKVLHTEVTTYNKEIPLYDIVDNGEYHNYFINVGNEDICVHNSGKTLFMMTEAVEALRQGKKVLYAAIGDLKKFDFVSRMCSIVMKIPMSKTAMNIKNTYAMMCKLFPYFKKNLKIQFMSPNKYTADEWYKMIDQMGLIDEYDVFFIDYDTNFASEKDSMYAKGDEVYTMAYRLSQRPGKYVFIASQPKVGTWKDQELGLESASESSRKQQIVDVMITISHDRDVKNPKNHIGIINIPKNRRGGNTSFSYFLDPTGIMMSITPEGKKAIKEDSEAVSVVQTEYWDKSTHLLPNAAANQDSLPQQNLVMIGDDSAE